MSGRVRRGLRSLVESRVVWLTSQRLSLDGSPAPARPWIVVLGREHYTERRKVYPIPGYADLQRVLQLELANQPETRAVIGPPRDDRRVVSFYDIDAATVPGLVGAAWVLPESLILARTLAEDGTALVERDGLAYFIAGSGESLPASGALRTPQMFALAVGLPSTGTAQSLAGQSLRSQVWQGLQRLPASAWLGLFRSPLTNISIPWRKLGLTAAAGVFGYLLLATAWLGIVNRLRTGELERLGPEVQTLLAARAQLERFSAERDGLSANIAASPATYPIWRVVSLAWQRGAQITGLGLTGRELTLRGRAPRATDVLEALTADPQLANAHFTLPVQRPDPSAEEFSLAVTLKEQGGHAN